MFTHRLQRCHAWTRAGGLAAFLLLLTSLPAIGETNVSPVPTFSRDVAPILYANCAVCHRPGEAAPFSLLTYSNAQKHAKQIAEITARRIMPPWKPDLTNEHFLGERRLSAEQIDMLRRWSTAGCPPGDLTEAPAPPKFVIGWQLGKPDLIATMDEPYTLAAGGRDVYRCFVLPVEIPKGKYIKAVEYRPGLAKIVHHAVLTTLTADALQKKLAVEPPGNGPGFSSGLAAPGERLPGPLGIWVPGKESQPLPEGYAAAWPKGQALVVQLHLHPDGKIEREQSSVGFYFTDERPRGKVDAVVFFNKDVDIAPDARISRSPARKSLNRT